MKKSMAKIGFSFLTICGFRVITVIEDEWGSPEEISRVAFRFVYLSFVLVRMAYTCFVDQSGRLLLQINSTHQTYLGLP